MLTKSWSSVVISIRRISEVRLSHLYLRSLHGPLPPTKSSDGNKIAKFKISVYREPCFYSLQVSYARIPFPCRSFPTPC